MRGFWYSSPIYYLLYCWFDFCCFGFCVLKVFLAMISRNDAWVKKMMWGRETFFSGFFEHKWDPQISLFLFVLMRVRETFHSWNYIPPKYHWSMWDFFIVLWPNWDHLLFVGQIDQCLIVCWPIWSLTLVFSGNSYFSLINCYPIIFGLRIILTNELWVKYDLANNGT